MPRFCESCSSDMFICQECGNDLCSRGCGQKITEGVEASAWIEGKGNVCMTCLSKNYIQTQGSWKKIENVKMPYSLKGNPAYDLMM